MHRALVLTLCLGIGVATMPVQAAEPAPAAEPTSDDVDTTLPIGPILLGSFGAVAVLVGAGFGWQAKQELDSFNERNPIAAHGDPLYLNANQSLADDIRMHAIVADVLMFGGAIAVGAGILWGVLGRAGREVKADAKASAKVRPNVGPNHLGLVLEF